MQFLAILRDSFREAVDGFLIYVMLGLSALAIVLIASLSFEPAPPSEAFTTIAQKFGTAYPNRGGGKEQIGIVVRRGPFNQALPLPIEFAATDVQRMDAGTGSSGSYEFRLTAKPKDVAGPAGKQAMGGMDWFRFLVAAWAKPELKELTVELDPKTGMPKLPNFGKPEKNENQEPAEAAGPGLDVTIPSITPEDMQGVTDEMMDDFIRNQFAIYAAMDQVSVRRVTNGVKEPGYAFEVETKSSGSVRGWPYVTRGLFGAFTLSRSATLGDMLFTIQDSIVNGIGAGVTLLIAVILTAFFIPNMIRKGSLDLLIAKPIGRLKLLIFKYIGGLLFILILSGFTVGGVWVVLGIRSGVWNPEFLLVIPILTFTFAILYSLSTMLGVLTRSAIVAILLTCLFAAFLYVVGFAKSTLDLVRADPKLKEEVPTWVVWTVDGLNNCLPRYKDLDKLTTKLLAGSTLTPGEIRSTAMNRLEYPSWGSAIGVSLGFIVLMLALASLRFVTRDG